MNQDAALAALHAHPWIHNFPWQHLETLANLAEEVHFEPGHTIFQQGQPSDSFYFINGGEVRLECEVDGRQVTVETVHPGQEIGWSALMEGGERHFTAKAETDVYAVVLTGVRLREACERNPSFGFVLLKHLLFVAGERLDATRMELIQTILRATPKN